MRRRPAGAPSTRTHKQNIIHATSAPGGLWNNKEGDKVALWSGASCGVWAFVPLHLCCHLKRGMVRAAPSDPTWERDRSVTATPARDAEVQDVILLLGWRSWTACNLAADRRDARNHVRPCVGRTPQHETRPGHFVQSQSLLSTRVSVSRYCVCAAARLRCHSGLDDAALVCKGSRPTWHK